MTKIIDASLLSRMIISGANNLSNNRDLVDALNVFPVPDGDTGTNMSLTFINAARGVEEVSDCEFITFVDGDDTLAPNSLEYLLLHIRKHDSDIAISPADKYAPQNKELISAEEYLILLLRDICYYKKEYRL